MGYKQMLNDQVVGNTPQNTNNNYEDMGNKPSINGIELVGNLSTEDLGIEVPEITVDSELSDASENPVQNKVVKEAINKVIEDVAPSIATSDEVGLVKPDGTTITIDEDGILHGNASVEVDAELSDTSENPVQNKVIYEELDTLKKSVSDGKSSVASAITEKGVTTQADATFQTMADNISQISIGADVSGVTATASTVLSGKKFVDKSGNTVTGTIQSMAGSTITPTTSAQTIACSGKYMTSNIVVNASSGVGGYKVTSGGSVSKFNSYFDLDVSKYNYTSLLVVSVGGKKTYDITQVSTDGTDWYTIKKTYGNNPTCNVSTKKPTVLDINASGAWDDGYSAITSYITYTTV